MTVTKEQIEAILNNLRLEPTGYCYAMDGKEVDIFNIRVSREDGHTIRTILQEALDARNVDVEVLKLADPSKTKEPDVMHEVGWNEAIDHLSANGYLTKPITVEDPSKKIVGHGFIKLPEIMAKMITTGDTKIYIDANDVAKSVGKQSATIDALVGALREAREFVSCDLHHRNYEIVAYAARVIKSIKAALALAGKGE